MRLYVAFAIFFGLQDFPSSAVVLLAFAEFLTRDYRAPKSVTNALSTLRTFHAEFKFATDAFEDYSLVLFKRALPLTLRHVPQEAAPLPVRVLEKLCGLALTLGVAGRVFAAFLATLFFSMARASSLLPRKPLEFDASRLPTLGDL